MNTCTTPIVIPDGWRKYSNENFSYIFYQTISLMRVIFSIECLEEGYIDLPPTGPGKYRHISISRENRYPEWDEMRDFIYSCGLFDSDKNVMMILSPKSRYINISKNCFHFFQKVN